MKSAICFLLAGAIFIITACNNQPTVKGMEEKDDTSQPTTTASNSDEDKEERNKKIALASVEGISRHDVNAALKDVAPNAADYGDGTQTPVKSKDSIVAMVNSWLKAFPDVKASNLNAVADGDWVVVWGDWSGTWKGDFMGQKATGKSYKIKDADIFRFNDEGQMTEHHTFPTWAAMAQQIGMKMQ